MTLTASMLKSISTLGMPHFFQPRMKSVMSYAVATNFTLYSVIGPGFVRLPMGPRFSSVQLLTLAQSAL